MVKRSTALGVIGSTFVWAFLLALAVVVIYPLLWMTLNGFKTNAELFGNPFALPVELRWENYANAWNRGVGNYLMVSVLVTVTSNIGPKPGASRVLGSPHQPVSAPQQRLYFFPEPHGHGALRPTFGVSRW